MRILDELVSPLWLLGWVLAAWLAASLLLPAPRALRAGALGVFACAWLLCTPVTANLALHLLERRASREALACGPPPAGALFIVLTGGLRDTPHGPDDINALSEASLRRTIAAAALARDDPGSRLLLSGGMGARWREADLMAALAKRLGVAPAHIELDRDSRTTLQSARNVARMLRHAPPGPRYLVTSAYHMPRAYMAFTRSGLRVCALPVDFEADENFTVSSWLPDLPALRMMSMAAHEFLGTLYYRWVKLG